MHLTLRWINVKWTKIKTFSTFYFTFSEEKTHVPGEGEFVGVPGELRGFEIAWKKYGSLPWKALFGPAIEIAANGFKATPALVLSIEKNAPNISNDPGLRLVETMYCDNPYCITTELCLTSTADSL